MDNYINLEFKEHNGKLRSRIKLSPELTEELKSKLNTDNQMVSVFFSEVLEEGFAKKGIKIDHVFVSETEAAA